MTKIHLSVSLSLTDVLRLFEGFHWIQKEYLDQSQNGTSDSIRRSRRRERVPRARRQPSTGEQKSTNLIRILHFDHQLDSKAKQSDVDERRGSTLHLLSSLLVTILPSTTNLRRHFLSAVFLNLDLKSDGIGRNSSRCRWISSSVIDDRGMPCPVEWTPRRHWWEAHVGDDRHTRLEFDQRQSDLRCERSESNRARAAGKTAEECLRTRIRRAVGSRSRTTEKIEKRNHISGL